MPRAHSAARRPYAPYASGAAPLELVEALATAWRLHAALLAAARVPDPGPERAAGEAAAETYRLALLPIDALLARHRVPPAPEVAGRARDHLAALVAQGRRLERDRLAGRREMSKAPFRPHHP